MANGINIEGGTVKVPYAILGMFLSAILPLALYWAATSSTEEQMKLKTATENMRIVTQLTSQVSTLTDLVGELRTIVASHVARNGHEVMNEKMNTLSSKAEAHENRLNGMENELDEIRANNRHLMGLQEILKNPRNYSNPEYPGFFKRPHSEEQHLLQDEEGDEEGDE